MNVRRIIIPLLVALAACSPGQQPVQQPPLAGARIGGPFTLTDQDGRTVTDRDLAGKYRIMYFGYTFCPDVCPLDMQNIGAAMKLLDKSDAAMSQRIVPVFVTIDPARDKPAVLKQFVGAFYPRMIGLTGTAPQIAAIAKEYGVYYARGKGNADGYMMDHSRQAYLMSPDGKPLALLPQEGPPQAIVAEIRKWAT